MKKLTKLQSYSQFREQLLKTEVKVENVVNTPMKESSTLKKAEPIKEAVIQVGDEYKVKVTVDVPVSLIKDYIAKVTQETGKDPLLNFSETEIAEQAVQYIIKQNLHIDSIPSAITVGETPAEEISVETQVDAAKIGAEFGEEQELDIEDVDSNNEVDGDDIQITDGDLSLDSDNDSTEISLEDDNDSNDIESEEDIELSDQKEEGDELELTDNETNLGEVRDVENIDTEETTTQEETTEGEDEPAIEFEEELSSDNESNTENTMSMDEIKFSLRRSGLDTREMTDQEIIDLYNDIFVEGDVVIGIDADGNNIKPSSI